MEEGFQRALIGLRQAAAFRRRAFINYGVLRGILVSAVGLGAEYYACGGDVSIRSVVNGIISGTTEASIGKLLFVAFAVIAVDLSLCDKPQNGP